MKPNTAGLSLTIQQHQCPGGGGLVTISMQQRDYYESDLEIYRNGIRKQLRRGGTGTVCRLLR